MGLLTLVEDRPTPKSVYNWRVYTLAAVASFASCMIGYDSAFIGTTIALPSFVSEFGFAKLDSSQLRLIQSNIVSVYQAGAFFGALAAYIGGYYLGRRWGLMLFSAIFCLGSGIMLAADGRNGIGLGPIYAGRVLAGFGVGGCSNLTPIYISELSPPAIRGRLVGLYELGWQIGGLVGFWINFGLNRTLAPSHTQWLIPFAVQLIPGGLLFFGTLWIRESPRWLFSKGRRVEGMRNLLWVRQLPDDDIYIVEEMRGIDDFLEAHGEPGVFTAVKNAVRSPRIMWRLFLGNMLFLWQNGSGINAINYYSPTVFKSLGIAGTDSSFLTTGLFGVVKTVGTLLWLAVMIDNLGRRNILMLGSFGGSICMWIIGAFVKGKQVSTSSATANAGAGLDGTGVAAIFFFYLWTFIYTTSWNGTPWVYNSEMFDMQTRPLGQALAAAANWLYNFLISRFTPDMFASMSYGVYFFFASLMVISSAFVWAFMPETKSVPLEKMDRLFEIRPPRKAYKVVMEEIKVEEQEFRRRTSNAAISDEKRRMQEHLESV